MLSNLQETAVDLYRKGKNLREVADKVSRSHEWVRQTLVKAGEHSRNRGRELADRPACMVCKSPCAKVDSHFCSRECMNKHRREKAMKKLNAAIKVLNSGGTYAEAAKKAGFQNAWHLWGRMYHFGLNKTAPSR